MRHSSWYIGVQWIAVVFGMIGNIALIVIFRKKLHLTFNGLILTLAFFDWTYLCIQITQSMTIYLDIFTDSDVEYHIMEVFSNVVFSLSTFTAIAMSIERYCLICHHM